MPPVSDHGQSSKGSRSSAEIDPKLYQFLYELERRLDEKFKDARTQNKEDISNALTIAMGPVNAKLDAMGTRLEAGDRRFQEQDARDAEFNERLDEQSGKIRGIADVCSSHHRKPSKEEATTALTKKASGGWISVDRIPAILQGIVLLIVTILSTIAYLRNPSNAPVQAPTIQSVAPAAQGTGP